MELEYRPGRRMPHVDALNKDPVSNYVDVNVVTFEDGDWFLTVQLQEPKVAENVQLLTTGDDNIDIKANYLIC